MAKKPKKLTDWEWHGITKGINLADGHARQSQKRYDAIINNLPEIFRQAAEINQKAAQEKFARAYFTLAGQKSYKLLRPLFNYSASTATEVVANYLRIKGKSASLIHPAFDNLADIMKRNQVKLYPLEEAWLHDIKKHGSKIKGDSLFIVCPNNPTGQEISEKEFSEIVKFCKATKKLLIIDFTFRFYSHFRFFDQYKILIDSGIDFIGIEDTGKTWPTMDLKIGFTMQGEKIHTDLVDINNDFILNVSPFIFVLLAEFINFDLKSKDGSYLSDVRSNANTIQRNIAKTKLKFFNSESNISACFLEIPQGASAVKLAELLNKAGLSVLPGNSFFWNNPKKGDRYIRLALARPREEFGPNFETLMELLDKFI